MMEDMTALKSAIDLIHIPSRVRHVRSNPLPDGMLLLLRVAAGDESATEIAAGFASRPAGVVREAAAFFIEQILLSPEADSYRVLGASRDATCGELRRNMVLLLKWLHPDTQREGDRSVFAGRVILAWDDLKTPERRRAYDTGRRTSVTAKSRTRGNSGIHGIRARRVTSKQQSDHPKSWRHSCNLSFAELHPHRGRLRRALLFLLGGGKA
jgi:hypothetical protein